MARVTQVNDIAVRFSQAAGAANTTLQTIQVTRKDGTPLAGRFPLDVWFTANLATLAETGTTYSGAVTATVGTIVNVVTAKKNLRCMTDANGRLTISIVDTENTEDFAVVQAYGLDPRVAISPAFTAWGE